MNERYEQLFAQAWIEFAPGHKAVLERFAELIVAECIKCADHVGLVTAASAYPNSTAHHIKQKIKDHFGVE